MRRNHSRDEETSQAVASFLMLPFSNQVHIEVDRLAEILRRYEGDRAGFHARIPRLR